MMLLQFGILWLKKRKG